MLQSTLRNPALCLIVDYSYVTDALFEQRINEVIDGGIDIVQFRDKNISHEEFLLAGERLKKNIRGRVLFAVNSNVRAARDLEADILHLPEITDNVASISFGALAKAQASLEPGRKKRVANKVGDTWEDIRGDIVFCTTEKIHGPEIVELSFFSHFFM